MFKKIFLLISFSLLSVNVVFAGATNCGDGNHHFDLDPHGTTVSYAASKNEFDVIRVDDGRVIIEDLIKCRFGKDSLRGIQTVNFIDGDIAVNDLVIHSAARVLALDVLKQQIQDAIAIEVARRGLTIESDVMVKDEEKDVNPGNTVFIQSGVQSNPYGSFGQYSGGQNIQGLQNGGYLNNPTATGNSTFSTQQPVFNQQSISGGSYSTDFGSDFANSTAYQPGQNTFVTVPVTWDASNVGYYDVVYFEASFDGEAQRQYLGSSTGFLGTAQVQVPSNLLVKEGLEVTVRSGTRVLVTIPIRVNSAN